MAFGYTAHFPHIWRRKNTWANKGKINRLSETYQKVKEVSVSSIDDDSAVVGPLDDHLVDLVHRNKRGRRNGER